MLVIDKCIEKGKEIIAVPLHSLSTSVSLFNFCVVVNMATIIKLQEESNDTWPRTKQGTVPPGS